MRAKSFGEFVIRIAIFAFRTKKETIDEAVEMIRRCLGRVLRGYEK